MRSQHSESVYFHVSPSKLYASKGHSQRYNTRYDVNPYQLEDAWQQLGVTEMTIIREGLFSNAASVAAQTGLLCRNAPTWDGFLRLPSSMHLGSAVARTHPMIQRPRRA
ncbi:DUF3893 domain-containing protein [Pseudomonas frederiksbergensis]|uniref:DUF3893 domain-containing protein n=1 Tax=Pseudomonas frederiksbergensis TaxID=104087 RepID=A0A423KGN0_9PSED|nr:DUF3893 domain-containing protein [Pseudomonas frederiksbergensis]